MARRPFLFLSLLTLAMLAVAPLSGSSARGAGATPLSRIQHIVVIYEENHSFDNLYGGWEGVNGLDGADFAHTVQIGQGGAIYTCLLQDDVNLTSPPLPRDLEQPIEGVGRLGRRAGVDRGLRQLQGGVQA